MEINITWNICRVCLVQDDKKLEMDGDAVESMRCLFTEDKLLAKQIYDCTGTMMKPNDNLPQKICKKCLMLLKCAVNFRKTCRTSDTYLQTLLQRTRAASLIFNSNELPSVYGKSNENSHEAKLITAKRDGKGIELLKLRRACLSKPFKKLVKQTNCPEINSNTDDLIAHIEEKQNEVFKIDLGNIEEMEQVLEDCETDKIQMFSSDRIDRNVSEDQESEVSENDCQTGEATNEILDELDEEIEEFYGCNKKFKFEEFYSLDEDINNKNITQVEAEQQNLQTESQLETIYQEDDNVEFLPIDEDDVELHQLLETNNDDSHAQVSSTVITHDEFNELQVQNSNYSNNKNVLRTEYVADEYLIDDSDSAISSKKIDAVTTNSTPTVKKHGTVVYPERKTRIEENKGFSVTALQQQKWICNICGNTFANRHILNGHIKIHRQEKNHECELCFKRFITACNLQAHMRIHTGEKPFKCQYCGRCFGDRSSNLRHERTHTNEKPFHCNDCGKSFSLSTTLKKHLKVHTGERSFRCDICVKSFKLPHQLKAHKNTTLHKAVEQLTLFEN